MWQRASGRTVTSKWRCLLIDGRVGVLVRTFKKGNAQGRLTQRGSPEKKKGALQKGRKGETSTNREEPSMPQVMQLPLRERRNGTAYSVREGGVEIEKEVAIMKNKIGRKSIRTAGGDQSRGNKFEVFEDWMDRKQTKKERSKIFKK